MPKATYKLNLFMYSSATRGGFKSEDTGEFLLLQNKYSKSLSWAENLKTVLTVLGWKFRFSAQDSNLEYLSWRSKNPPVSSDLKPSLRQNLYQFEFYFIFSGGREISDWVV